MTSWSETKQKVLSRRGAFRFMFQVGRGVRMSMGFMVQDRLPIRGGNRERIYGEINL